MVTRKNRTAGTANNELTVFFEGRMVGSLQFDAKKNSFHLIYSSEWTKEGFALSPHLPLSSEHPVDAATRFLENLLPEGHGLKELARTLKVTTSNIYSLVTAIGKDATGAFTISNDEKIKPNSFREIPTPELKRRIKERAKRPITVWDGKPRLSLAGVQEKIALVIKDKKFGLGEGTLASTHILKFGNKATPHLVLNEYFCMKLMSETSLRVAKVELINLSERVLLVERFDRKWKSADEVERLHIIDGCQALDLAPAFKYEKAYGRGASTNDLLSPANIENIYGFAQSCKVPASAQLITLQWIFANLILGNCDHHAKNISYYVNEKGIEIAPIYDLLNITLYEGYDHELAFEIGGTFDLQKLNFANLKLLASELGLAPRFVANQLKKIANEIIKAIPAVKVDDLSEQEARFLEKMIDDISNRAKRLLKEASKLEPSRKKIAKK